MREVHQQDWLQLDEFPGRVQNSMLPCPGSDYPEPGVSGGSSAQTLEGSAKPGRTG